MRKPSDLGFDDARFALPDLILNRHIVEARSKAEGTLFELPAIGLREERDEARRTITERCEQAAALMAHDRAGVVWCHLNAEGDLLERLIPDAEQISGSDSLERKEELLTAFSHGEVRVLVTKPKIGAWGLNWQHAHHMTFFPSHSYEQYYQAVRRMWRFGQKHPVTVDIVATEGSKNALDNLQRKATQADEMFAALVAAHAGRRARRAPAPSTSRGWRSRHGWQHDVLDQSVTDRYAIYNGRLHGGHAGAAEGIGRTCRSTRRRSPGCTSTAAASATCRTAATTASSWRTTAWWSKRWRGSRCRAA